jgi:trimethylamine--corrinoid protein Co-methyltransferase
LDIEALQTIAALCRPAPAGAEDLGFDAIAEVPPGGHFFATAQTMARYQTAFRTPLVADLSNHGLWVENGALRADERATAIWQAVLAETTPPAACAGVAGRLAGWLADRRQAGGVLPED